MRLSAVKMRVTQGLTLATSSLVMVVLLTTAGDAATPGAGSAPLAVSVQQMVTPVFAGAMPPGPRVIVPVRPIPRSPCRPPTWIPGKPPWVPGRPPVIPPGPPWAR